MAINKEEFIDQTSSIDNILNIARDLERKSQDTPQKFVEQMQLQSMKNQYNKDRDLIRKYNDNPKYLNDSDARRAIRLANIYGLSVDLGRRKDTADWVEIATGFGGGAVDSMLLGILKDEWYKSRRNKDWVTAGKIAGIIASIATPASWTAGAKVGGNLFANALRTGVKYGTLPGMFGGVKRLAGTVQLAKLGAATPKAASQVAKSYLQRGAAKAITSGRAKYMAKLLGSSAFQKMVHGGAAKAASGAKGLFGTLGPYAGAAAGGAAGIRGFIELVNLFKEKGVEDPYVKAMEIMKQRQTQMPQQQQRIS